MRHRNIGRFEIQSEIGGNERGTVYRAIDPENKRLIALKLLKSQFLYTLTSEKKFHDAAEKLRSLTHPAILPILEYGDEDNRPFLIMPLMEKGNLSARLGGQMPLKEALAIFTPLADALDTVAGKGIFHADLKPNNVLFSDREEPLLADLGLLQIIESLSFSKSMATNPQYISPEQVRRRPLTSETHVYSLAAMVFHALAGRPVFTGATEQVTSFKHVSEKPPRLRTINPQISPETEAVLNQALSKKPEQRYRTCNEFLGGLQQTASGALTLAEIRQDRRRSEPRPAESAQIARPMDRPPRPHIRQVSPASARRMVLSLAVFIAICMLGFGLLFALLVATPVSP